MRGAMIAALRQRCWTRGVRAEPGAGGATRRCAASGRRALPGDLAARWARDETSAAPSSDSRHRITSPRKKNISTEAPAALCQWKPTARTCLRASGEEKERAGCDARCRRASSGHKPILQGSHDERMAPRLGVKRVARVELTARTIGGFAERGGDGTGREDVAIHRSAILEFHQKPVMAKATPRPRRVPGVVGDSPAFGNRATSREAERLDQPAEAAVGRNVRPRGARRRHEITRRHAGVTPPSRGKESCSSRAHREIETTTSNCLTHARRGTLRRAASKKRAHERAPAHREAEPFVLDEQDRTPASVSRPGSAATGPAASHGFNGSKSRTTP